MQDNSSSDNSFCQLNMVNCCTHSVIVGAIACMSEHYTSETACVRMPYTVNF